MKQKIIVASIALASVGFLAKDKITHVFGKNSTGTDTVTIQQEKQPVDSILEKSQKSINSIGQSNMKSDSMIIVHVEKAAKKIEVLHNQVQTLKKENNELKAKLSGDYDRHFKLLPISNDAKPNNEATVSVPNDSDQ